MCTQTRFRFALPNEQDCKSILRVNVVNTHYSSDVAYTVEDYRRAIVYKNEFFLLAERWVPFPNEREEEGKGGDAVLVSSSGGGVGGRWVVTGVVNYYFMWFTGGREQRAQIKKRQREEKEREKRERRERRRGGGSRGGGGGGGEKERERVRVESQRACYVATLQATKSATHAKPALPKEKEKEKGDDGCMSERNTGVVLLSLALEHARRVGMQAAYLDATPAR